MQDNEVSTSFEILLEELENIVEMINQEGARQFRNSEHEKARQTLEKVDLITSFRGKVKQLQNEWNTVEAKSTNKRKSISRKRGKKKSPARLERGLRTPEDEFRIPVLDALVRLGGSAQIGDVMDILAKKMASVLNEYDWQTLPSVPNVPRWRNTAQWSRQSLVNDGYLSADSPKGTWKITDSGREFLKASGESSISPRPTEAPISKPKLKTIQESAESPSGDSKKQFVDQVLKRHFGGGFSRVGGYQLMFVSDTQLVYFQNYDKEADHLWYRLSKKPRQELESTDKQAWLCLTHPLEKYAYIIPIKAIEEKIKQYEWKKDDLEISIYPLTPINETRWHQFKWELEGYRHEFK